MGQFFRLVRLGPGECRCERIDQLPQWTQEVFPNPPVPVDDALWNAQVFNGPAAPVINELHAGCEIVAHAHDRHFTIWTRPKAVREA